MRRWDTLPQRRAHIWKDSTNGYDKTGDAAGNFASKDNLDSLLANMGGHGNQLNQPEVNWATGEFYPVANTVDFWDFGVYNYEIWNTEIARRASLMSQSLAKATTWAPCRRRPRASLRRAMVQTHHLVGSNWYHRTPFR